MFLEGNDLIRRLALAGEATAAVVNGDVECDRNI
jgi:hypothetical protein